METKEDFKITEKQQHIIDELKSFPFEQLVQQIQKDPELELELKQWLAIDMSLDDMFEFLPNDPDSFHNTKNKIVNLLFEKEWNHA